MTLADKTKQYFAEDGRLIGIVDRFGNTIKFEHTMSSVTNIVPEGSFRYDDDMWMPSTAANGTYDAYPVDDFGRNDDYSMYFRRNNADDTYIISQPIQVKPLTTYNMGVSIYSPYADDGELVDKACDIAKNTYDETKPEIQMQVKQDRINKIEKLYSKKLITEEEYRQALSKKAEGDMYD